LHFLVIVIDIVIRCRSLSSDVIVGLHRHRALSRVIVCCRASSSYVVILHHRRILFLSVLSHIAYIDVTLSRALGLLRVVTVP